MIVEDAWGATPLLYAVWGEAPSEIVEFLINSYLSLYPDNEFDWDGMMVTLCRADASEDVMQNLLNIQQTLSPEYNIDWNRILGALERITKSPTQGHAVFCFLIRCSIATRVNAIGVKHFREALVKDNFRERSPLPGHSVHYNRAEWRAEILATLEFYESEYQKLKDSTTLLELALWKSRMDDSSFGQGETVGGGNKKMKMDESNFRLQCRINCGADHVVENVWPYLLPQAFVYSNFNEDNSDEEEDDEDDDDDDDDDDNTNSDDDEVEEWEWEEEEEEEEKDDSDEIDENEEVEDHNDISDEVVH